MWMEKHYLDDFAWTCKQNVKTAMEVIQLPTVNLFSLILNHNGGDGNAVVIRIIIATHCRLQIY